jgi:hypothetical protein
VEEITVVKPALATESNVSSLHSFIAGGWEAKSPQFPINASRNGDPPQGVPRDSSRDAFEDKFSSVVNFERRGNPMTQGAVLSLRAISAKLSGLNVVAEWEMGFA